MLVNSFEFRDGINAAHHLAAAGLLQNQPQIGIILGSGMDGLAAGLQSKQELSYTQIPDFPQSTVSGHKGAFLSGYAGNIPILAMQGRFHHYEGYSIAQIISGIYLMHNCGIRKVIITNAAGGLNPIYNPGDLMLLNSHINLMNIKPPYPFSYWPHTNSPYSARLISLAEQTALNLGISLKQGVYAAMSGPTYETRAEIKMLRSMGADAVGMSTVPEALAASALNMEILAISIITNKCSEIPHLRTTTHQEVLHVSGIAGAALSRLIDAFLPQI
jgi:purine-nucleoside phosphorylase